MKAEISTGTNCEYFETSFICENADRYASAAGPAGMVGRTTGMAKEVVRFKRNLPFELVLLGILLEF